MLSLWIGQGWIDKKHFESIQKFVDDLILPSHTYVQAKFQ